MAACTVCTVSAPSVPVARALGGCQGRRVRAPGVGVASWQRDCASAAAAWLPGCDFPATWSRVAAAAAASPSAMRASLALRTGARGSSGRRRSVVCEVAVTIGDASGEKAAAAAGISPGSKIRVKGPLTVYHVMKSPNLQIEGMEGEVKEVLGIFKGKKVSATYPVKAQFSIDVAGKPIKFICHFKADEVELVE